MIGAATIASLALLLGASAAYAAPGVTTGGASNVSANGARVSATVDPNGQATTYYFEYGTTQRYGSRTPDANAGNGKGGKGVSADIGGLTANTDYHYRIVASNPSGVQSGGDRTFKTKPQPLGLNITASPNPVVFGSPTTVSGTLTGSGNANHQVVLQQRPFPYSAAWANAGNPQVTDASGNFAFPILSLPITTQFQVVTNDKPAVASPVLTLGVAVSVKTNVSTTRVHKGGRVRFSGVIRPARAGAQWAIQKQTKAGAWATVAGSITHGGSKTFSGFTKRVRVARSGVYRVFVLINDGNLTSGIGRTITITAR
jgi:hypothetical protein